jgi:hypothetical protein
MRAGVAQGGLVSPVLFSLYVNDIPTPSRHVELAQYADDTALEATSPSSSLLSVIWRPISVDWSAGYGTGGLPSTLKKHCLLFVKAARHIQKPRAVQFLGKPIQWVETARYLGVTLDTRLTWSAHVNQIEKKAFQRLGVLGPLLNRRSGLSVRNGVLLYKQLIRPMIDSACPIWRSAARSHIRNLQVLQSKCLRIATNAPWCVNNRQIHEDLGIPFFADHIRALTEFRLKVS